MSSQSAESQAYVSEGEILAGKYRVDKVLGVGGMGMVVAAHHLQLDDRVALKFLLPEALANPEAVARFDREARAAVKIKSEHVARVIDVGKLDSGAPYMVMEYLEGCDLDAWIRRRGALSVEQAVEFVLQACEAIAEAHGLGIIHRDLKPSNLFCIRLPDGMLSVKVIDFGISKLTGLGAGSDLGMTKTQTMMGSPMYMSPEQMASAKGVDSRTDIWALGVILYELLAGRPPFQGDQIPELVIKVVNSPTPSLLGRCPDVPEALQLVIFRCLEKDRNNRYQNVGELALALLEFAPKRSRLSVERVSRLIQAAGLSESVLVLPASSRTVQVLGTPAATSLSFGATTGSSPSAKKIAVGGAGVAALVAGIVAIGLALRSMSAASETSKPLVQSLVQPSPQVSASQSAPSVSAAVPTATSAQVISADSLPIASKKSPPVLGKKSPAGPATVAPAKPEVPAKADAPPATAAPPAYNPRDHL